MINKNSGDSDELKYSHWMMTVQSVGDEELISSEKLQEIFSLQAKNYTFQLEEATSKHYQCYFTAKVRARRSTLINAFVELTGAHPSSFVLDRRRGTHEEALAYVTKTTSKIGPTITTESVYQAKDIDALDKNDTRYPWQGDIIKSLIDESTSTIKTADDRTIVWIEDLQGGNGKSKLVKWCCFNYDDCAKVSFGTANQLRSSLIACGVKKIYFIDIPRTLGDDDSMGSMFSAIEDLKNGFLVSAMYGKHQSLMLDPPHIIIFSNQGCPDRFLSADRWFKYSIRDKRLVPEGSDYGFDLRDPKTW